MIWKVDGLKLITILKEEDGSITSMRVEDQYYGMLQRKQVAMKLLLEYLHKEIVADILWRQAKQLEVLTSQLKGRKESPIYLRGSKKSP